MTVYRPIELRDGGKSRAQFLQECLSTCLVGHKDCCPRFSDLPPILIDITSAPGPRLVESSSLFGKQGDASQVHYAALSHKASSSDRNPVKTTAESLPLFKEALPLDTLCEYFQHAMKLTQSLGIKYLWIDHLCTIHQMHPINPLQCLEIACYFQKA
jgi:hypothetical protein